MNLVVSGPVDPNLRAAVLQLTNPCRVVRLHGSAYRFEAAADTKHIRTKVNEVCVASRVDYAYVDPSVKFSNLKLLAIDMDSTLIPFECIDEIAKFAGRQDEVSAITEATMRGELDDFAESLRRRVSLLRGTSLASLETIYKKTTLTPGADRLGRALAFRETHANTLIHDGQALSGAVKEPIFDAEGKADVLVAAMKSIPCDSLETVVIGDGANDIPMMRHVTNSISYHGKPAVQDAATYNIRYGDLTVALDYLNYVQEPFRQTVAR